jgi:ribosomal protein S18 acetylase RimI-like enzyme
MEKSIQKAKEMHQEILELYTNAALTKALDIYRKYGFRVVRLDNHPTKRADIKMELNLKPEKK